MTNHLWGDLWGTANASYGAFWKPLERMAGTTGLEPATSAVTVLRRRKYLPIPNDGKRYLEAVLMRLWLCFGVCHPFLSNTERSRSRLVGMTRLRHKSRHKPDCPLELSRGYPPRCRMDAPARAQFRKNKNGAGVGALMVLRRPGYRRWLTLGRGALRLQPFRKAGGP